MGAVAVTIKDVAAMAGVSRATVSRVINGTAQVSSDKEEAVRRAIRKTGFQVSLSARRLAKGKAESIAVVLTEPVDQLFHDPTYTSILRGIMEGLGETEFSPLLISAANDTEREKARRLLGRKAADAIIHLSPYTDDSLLSDMSLQSVPLVLCGLPSLKSRVRQHSVVYSDDAEGAQMVAEYLKGVGAKNVLPLLGPAENPASSDRLLGFHRGLGSSLKGPVYVGNWTEQGGYTKMREYLQSVQELDAVVCGNDRIAVGAIEALEEGGLNVPRDVRVFGFDDHAIASANTPTISTVYQPFRQQGEAAVRLALDLVNGGKPTVEVLETTLVLRESG